jgi:hypothetical protein
MFRRACDEQLVAGPGQDCVGEAPIGGIDFTTNEISRFQPFTTWDSRDSDALVSIQGGTSAAVAVPGRSGRLVRTR